MGTWRGRQRVRCVLGISLKSLLRNVAGTVPNRVDDLTGEMANVQLLSPEIVTGYIMVFDTTGSGLRQDGTRWVDFFREAVERLSGRDAPAWAAGMVEASAVVEVDFSQAPGCGSRHGRVFQPPRELCARAKPRYFPAGSPAMTDKPKPDLWVQPMTYQPKKAEKEENMSVDGSPGELLRAVMRPREHQAHW